MRILVVGGTGLVGSHVVEEAVRRGHDVTSTYHEGRGGPSGEQLDKRDAADVAALVERSEPAAIVDAGAYVDVDGCETDRGHAWDVNAQGTRHLAGAVGGDVQLIELSTDYVFPGNRDSAPYAPGDPVDPVNYYGRTKLAGEQAVRLADRWTILRTSVVYASEGDNFATWLLDGLSDGDGVDVVDDQVNTPTFARDVASACVDVAESGLTGVYHGAGPERISRYDFALELAEAFGHDPGLIRPTISDTLDLTADRPMDSSLDSSQLQDSIDTDFLTPSEALETMAADCR